jgi:multimeric flavodoxin WrbA
VNNDLLKRKVGAAVVAVRRQGACAVFSELNFFFLIQQMVIPGSSYWNLGIGLNPGDIQKDSEGIDTLRTLGKNMAWLLKKLA